MLEIIDTIDVIEKRIMRAIVKKFNIDFPRIVSAVETDIANHFAPTFIAEPEYSSLISGELQRSFGLPSADAIRALDKIIDTLSASVKVKFKKFSISGNASVNGGLTLQAVKDDFSDILSLPEAKITTAKGQPLNWLEWLLIEGDNVIIADYHVQSGNYSQSRSGGAIMIKSSGSTFRVPPQFSGVINNNWITRAIDHSLVHLERLATASIQRQLAKVL